MIRPGENIQDKHYSLRQYNLFSSKNTAQKELKNNFIAI